MNKCVLSVLAHPDDAEFLCAGTLLRLVKELGWSVHIATMTPGDCGSAEHTASEISRIRRAEGSAAAAVLGGKYHCLEERDLLVCYQEKALDKVTRLLREVRPDIVLTHSPADYMLDHEMTSTLTRAACFAAPVPNFLCDRGHPAPLAHIPHLYYCDPIEGKNQFGEVVLPSFCIDISRTLETKLQMLACHASQRSWLMKHHGMDQYLQAARDWSIHQGKLAGCSAAEGFRQHLGHSYPQNNLLAELLGSAKPG